MLKKYFVSLLVMLVLVSFSTSADASTLPKIEPDRHSLKYGESLQYEITLTGAIQELIGKQFKTRIVNMDAGTASDWSPVTLESNKTKITVDILGHPFDKKGTYELLAFYQGPTRGGWYGFEFQLLDDADPTSLQGKPHLLSPREQRIAGIQDQDIKCKEGFEWTIKARTTAPTCVTPQTKSKLIEIGWAKNSDLQNKVQFVVDCAEIKPAVNLHGCSLFGTILNGVDLSNADLSFADLRNSDLSNAKFTYANLAKALLSSANFTNADFSNAELTAADFRSSDLSNANFSNAELIDADFRSANLSNANLGGARIENANFIDATLKGAQLSKTLLSKAELEEADLSFANLRDALLGKANLHHATLANADLHNAMLSDADLGSANLHDADLNDANLSGSDLSAADLSGADLSGANLDGADITYANLSGTHGTCINHPICNTLRPY